MIRYGDMRILNGIEISAIEMRDTKKVYWWVDAKDLENYDLFREYDLTDEAVREETKQMVRESKVMLKIRKFLYQEGFLEHEDDLIYVDFGQVNKKD